MQRLIGMILCFVVAICLIFPTGEVLADRTITNNETGNEGGYDYELWKDHGTTSMTLSGGGTFSCSWSNIGNALFRKGKKLNATQTYSQLGNISVTYGADYQPNGNSYLCVYGWSKSPLVEFYIVDSWGSWRPPGASSKGTITVDGGTYDVYETTRVNQPSIEGNATFQQFWSVRTSRRTSGTISVSEHFRAWERMGMRLGNIYEVALTVEGYQSSGYANVYQNTLTIGGSGGGSGGGGSGGSGSGSATIVQCESMTRQGPYAGAINNPFSGVALYANGDTCVYTQYFESGTHSFTLRGCSNNDNMARVDLRIGGVTKGTFYFGGPYPAEYSIDNVSHGTGNQQIELVVTSDNNTWDAYVDYLKIGPTGTGTGTTG
ncbi:MAG: glycoside hydrolase family 11 protein [Clostridiales bacterium]|nr:glycoside hydrolase family 11 protein [Clostridiales bacterium]